MFYVEFTPSVSLTLDSSLPQGSQIIAAVFCKNRWKRFVGNDLWSFRRGGTPRIIATPVTAYAVPPAPSQTWSARLLEALRDPPCLLTSAPRCFVHRTRFGASPPFSERAILSHRLQMNLNTRINHRHHFVGNDLWFSPAGSVGASDSGGDPHRSDAAVRREAA